jgi:NADH:ubiquinone oxidoreductase subunit E
VSRNLVELIRRHHAVEAPTALELLKTAVEDHGEVTDEDLKRVAEVSGLPEAAVYGVSSFRSTEAVRARERQSASGGSPRRAQPMRSLTQIAGRSSRIHG